MNVVLMLVHRLRRWPNNKTTFSERLVLYVTWEQARRSGLVRLVRQIHQNNTLEDYILNSTGGVLAFEE